MRRLNDVEELKVQRAAKALLAKYGISALPKVVAAASTLLEENKKKQAEYWIAIADEIQFLQKEKQKDRAHDLEEV